MGVNYECELWTRRSKYTEKMHTAWRIAMPVFPNRSSSELLCGASSRAPREMIKLINKKGETGAS